MHKNTSSSCCQLKAQTENCLPVVGQRMRSPIVPVNPIFSASKTDAPCDGSTETVFEALGRPVTSVNVSVDNQSTACQLQLTFLDSCGHCVQRLVPPSTRHAFWIDTDLDRLDIGCFPVTSGATCTYVVQIQTTQIIDPDRGLPMCSTTKPRKSKWSCPKTQHSSSTKHHQKKHQNASSSSSSSSS